MLMVPLSARTEVFGQTLERSPMTTSPMICALGSMYADSAIRGAMPRYERIMIAGVSPCYQMRAGLLLGTRFRRYQTVCAIVGDQESVVLGGMLGDAEPRLDALRERIGREALQDGLGIRDGFLEQRDRGGLGL